ncbi:HlyC/CorC family transporter [Hyphococcus flavus]|uniref:HlyC/CorC family transporter n=1 Tax=Hyphococcus flavus TaxID=1866326 RepID=A0AAE9ZEN7_9PROT|nr:HlyC/CorC family transporter [Hyphococcus flavus]WDI31732.1 HlyC/CorC family transporter [Hyphococcus flavus]
MSELEPSFFFSIGSIVLLLLLSAFFSGSETALTATSKARMHKLEADGDLSARRVNLLIRDKERLIGAILLGNNLVNILATSIATTLLISFFGEAGVANIVATVVMTALVLVCSEVTPKTLAISRPDSFAMVVAPIMRWVVFTFAPITRIVQLIVRGFLHLFGIDVSKDSAVFSVADELRGAIDLHHSEGRVDKESRDLIRGALDLNEIRTEEIMIHRKSIEMLDLDRPNEAIIRQALKSAHTRLPLYRENPDNIIGILHAKDLLRALWDAEGDADAVDFEALAREPYFAPETTTLQEQLDAFKLKQEHFALIVDEYGALMGLVTLEDILEEIVGEIEDEYDSPVQGVRPQGDGSLNVDGDVTIRDLNRAMDWNLPDDEAVTLAGLVIHEAQSIPEVGQTFSYHGFRFKILRRRRNQITALKITPIAESAF